MRQLIPLLIILGPTGSGKTNFSVRLARLLDGEIINADSRQVYKYMDIGTQKITKKEMHGIPHYLFDIKTPNERFSVGEYKILAEKKIEEIFSRRKIPILVGGTGLYIDAVADNFQFGGRYKRKKGRRKYDVIKIGINCPRHRLYRKLEKRVFIQIKKGLLIETEKLIKMGYENTFPMKSFVYNEAVRHLKGEMSKKEMVSKIQQYNRNYAKRQITWWRRDREVIWL